MPAAGWRGWMREGRGRSSRLPPDREVVTHGPLGVVADMDSLLRSGAQQCQHAGTRQIVGMDVVGVDIVRGLYNRRALNRRSRG